jgi:hypothetical protein
MSSYIGPPSAPDANCILILDAVNPKSIKGRRSLINWDDWVAGANGSITGYAINGSSDENRRLAGTNPFGTNDVVWQSSNNDVASGADGGWNGALLSVDPTKLHRYSTWVRRYIAGDGSFYLGVYGYKGGVNVGYLQRANTAVAPDTNPYFISNGLTSPAGVVNTWVLAVGHVWPVGSGNGSAHADSGVWNTGGTKLISTSDYIFPNNSVSNTMHRSYLYYTTIPETDQRWYQPRIDVCDGTEPTLSELLSDIGNKWIDLSGFNNHASFQDGPTKLSSANSSLIFNGTTSRCHLASPTGKFAYRPINGTGSVEMSIEFWVKNSDTAGYIISKPFNGSGDYNYMVNNTTFATYATNQNLLNYSTLGTGTWKHVVCLANSTMKSVYVNGVLAAGPTAHSHNGGEPTSGEQNVSLSLMTLYPYNGGWAGDVNHAMAGELGHVKFYTRQITPSEVLENFNALRGRYSV